MARIVVKLRVYANEKKGGDARDVIEVKRKIHTKQRSLHRYTSKKPLLWQGFFILSQRLSPTSLHLISKGLPFRILPPLKGGARGGRTWQRVRRFGMGEILP